MRTSSAIPDGTDPEWKGAWGPNPPFHTPTFILTHQPRPSLEMEGGTTFHFIDASPAEALETAREAADGQDVRIGGGPTIVRDFLAAGLIDHMHIVVVPITARTRRWISLVGGTACRMYCFAVDVVVDPDAQGQGIGQGIMDALEALVTRRQFGTRLDLVAAPDVVPFYRRLG